MASFDPSQLQVLFACKIAEILPEELHPKLFTGLGIMPEIVEAYGAEEPTMKAQSLLKNFMKKEKFQSFDKLLLTLNNSASADVSAQVKRTIEEIIIDILPEKVNEFWLHLGISEETIDALEFLSESKRNAALMKIWRKDPTHTIEILLVTITEFSPGGEQVEQKAAIPVGGDESSARDKRTSQPLPKAKHKAIPLCYPNNYVWDEALGTLKLRKEIPREEFILNKEAVSLIESIKYPVCLVSIVGDTCTGKSYIINQLQDGVNKKGIFNVSSSFKGCTKGLWISGEPFLKRLEDGTDVAVILMDSEGLDALEASQSEILFVLTILISSLLIYNCKNFTKPESSTKLRHFDMLASAIQVYKKGNKNKANSEDFFRFSPDLFWLLRDITSRLTIEKKGQLKEVETKDFILLEILNTNECSEESLQGKKQKKLRESIINYFPVFDGLKLPIPSSCADVIEKLNEEGTLMNANEIAPEFAHGIKILRQKLNKMMKPKKMWPQAGNVYGSHLSKFLEMSMTAINNKGKLPCLQSLWEEVTKTLLVEKKNTAIRLYEDKFRSILSSDDPCDEMEILEQHGIAFCKAIDLYTKETQHINDATLRIQQYRELQDIVVGFDQDNADITGGILHQYISKNENASYCFCRKVLDEEFHSMKIKSFQRNKPPKSLENIRKIILNTIDEYNEKAKGPKKLIVLKEHLKENILNIFFKGNQMDLLGTHGVSEREQEESKASKRVNLEMLQEEEKIPEETRFMSSEADRHKSAIFLQSESQMDTLHIIEKEPEEKTSKVTSFGKMLKSKFFSGEDSQKKKKKKEPNINDPEHQFKDGDKDDTKEEDEMHGLTYSEDFEDDGQGEEEHDGWTHFKRSEAYGQTKAKVGSDEDRQKRMQTKLHYFMRQGEHELTRLRRNIVKEEERLQDERLRLMRCAADQQIKAWNSYFKQQKYHQTVDEDEIRKKQEQLLANRKRIYEHNAAILEEARQERETDMNTLLENNRRARQMDDKAYYWYSASPAQGPSEASPTQGPGAASMPQGAGQVAVVTNNKQVSTVNPAMQEEQVAPMVGMMQKMMTRDQQMYSDMYRREQYNMRSMMEMIYHKDAVRGQTEDKLLGTLEKIHKSDLEIVKRGEESRTEEADKHKATLLEMQRESRMKEQAMSEQHKEEIAEREQREEEERRRREQDANVHRQREDRMRRDILEKEEAHAREREEWEQEERRRREEDSKFHRQREDRMRQDILEKERALAREEALRQKREREKKCKQS